MKIELPQASSINHQSRVSSNRAAPSSHPFYFRIFHQQNHPAIGGDLHVWSALDALTVLLEELSELLHLKPCQRCTACRSAVHICIYIIYIYIIYIIYVYIYILSIQLPCYTWILLVFHIPKSGPNSPAFLRVAVASCLSVLRTKLCDRPEVQEYSEERRPLEKSSSLFAPSPATAFRTAHVGDGWSQ